MLNCSNALYPVIAPATRRHRILVCCICASACSAMFGLPVSAGATEAAAEPVAVPDLRTLLLIAIDSPDGKASGYLSGPTGSTIRSLSATGAPLMFDISTVSRFAQAGCSRLRIRGWQKGPSTTEAAGGGAVPLAGALVAELNYCRDGRPPAAPAAPAAPPLAGQAGSGAGP